MQKIYGKTGNSKNMQIKLFFIFIFIIAFKFSFAQKEIQLKNIKGSYALSDNITPEQAITKATDNAKKQALIQAGIPENVVSTDILLTSENKGKVKEYFQSLNFNEVYGNVVLNSKPIVSKKLDEFQNVVYEVSVDVTVYKYDKLGDPSFTFDVKGFQKYYKNNDKLNLEIKPNKNGYIRIFLIDEEELCTQIYPNLYEKDKIMNENETFIFPSIKGIDYALETNKEKESNFLFIVFLKQKITPPSFKNANELLKWIYTTPPTERKVEYYAIQFEN